MADKLQEVKFLIINEQDKLVIVLPFPRSIQELQEGVKEKCEIDASEIWYEDSDFQTFVRLTAISALPVTDKMVLKVKTKDHTTTMQHIDAEIPEAGASTSTPQASTSTPQASTSTPQMSPGGFLRTATSKEIVVPCFDFEIEKAIQLKSPSDPLKKELKIKILDKLASTIYSESSAYPSGHVCEQWAKALINKWPCLAEKVTDDDEGWEGWKVSIAFKMGNFRNKLRKLGVLEVQLNHGKRSKFNKTLPHARKGLKIPKKGELNWQPDFPNKDEEVMEDISSMKEMMKKGLYGKETAQIMARTFARRRLDINRNMPLSEVKEKWPALFVPTQVLAEFSRITNTAPESTFFSNLDKDLTKLRTAVLPKKSEELKKEKEIYEKAKKQNMNGVDSSTIDRTFGLRSLPHYFGENAESFFLDLDEGADTTDMPSDPTPVVICLGDPYMSTEFLIVVDGQPIFEDIKDFPTGVLLLFALHYCLNLDYNIKFTYEFLQKHIMKLEPKKLSLKVRSLLSKFRK